MKRLVIALILGLALSTNTVKAKEDVTCADIDAMRICEVYEEIQRLRIKVNQLEALKAHFYDFRERIYKTVPVDYLSSVTIDDFDFDRFFEEEEVKE